MQTLQQQRAKHALGKVKDLILLNQGAKLKSRASELPFMIHANGLGQAAAFFKSKGDKGQNTDTGKRSGDSDGDSRDKDGYGKIYLILQSWLTQPGRPFAGQTDLMLAITEADLHTYRVAQAEAMQYMDWVKKFATTYL